MEPSNHLSQTQLDLIPILSHATIFTGIGHIEQKMLADK